MKHDLTFQPVPQLFDIWPTWCYHGVRDALVITEAEPLVDYVPFTAAKSIFVGDKSTEFISFVEQELAPYGAIRVTKGCRIFEAWRDGGA